MANKRIQDLENAEELLNDMLIPVAGLNKTQSAQLSQLRSFLNKYLVELNNQNFNELTDDGFYQCGGTSQNAPVGQAITWVVSVVKDQSFIIQTAYSTDATSTGGAYPNTYRRRYNGASWSDWEIISVSLSALYPVGSLFFSTARTCPLQDLGIGTWQNVGTSLTLSVNTSVPVKGTGIAMGLMGKRHSTGNIENFGLYGYRQSNSAHLTSAPAAYNTNIGTFITANGDVHDTSMGLTTDSSKSGIVGTVTRTQINVNIFQRIS